MAKRYMSELVLKKSVTILVKNSFYKKEEIINFASEICNLDSKLAMLALYNVAV